MYLGIFPYVWICLSGCVSEKSVASRLLRDEDKWWEWYSQQTRGASKKKKYQKKKSTSRKYKISARKYKKINQII